MSTAMITEMAIVSAMKQLMQFKSFNNISIKDIINECGVSRKTFYYHFRDKYDVVNWLFKTDIFDTVLDSTTLENWADGSLKLCQYIYNNKAFYTNAINVTGKNSFKEYLNTLTRLQVEKLTTQACRNRIVGEADKEFMIDFFYNAFVGILITWINDEMKDTPEVIVNRWKTLTDKSLENYVNVMAK